MQPVTLYKTNKHGKQQAWTVQVSDLAKESGAARISITYGQNHGKMQTTTRDIMEGKNKNKKSETTPLQQAILEAQSLLQHKKDQGYRETQEDPKDPENQEDPKDQTSSATTPVLPMLAEDYKHRGHNIYFPCFVQPKLDGVRCMAKKEADGTVTLTSRMGKPFSFLDHIRRAIPSLPTTVYLDGELFTKQGTFQDITSICKQTKTPHSQENTIVYHVFDFYDTALPDLTFAERLCALEKMKLEGPVCLVLTEPLEQADQVMAKLQQYVSQGHEGIVLRNAAGIYACHQRSACLQKFKQFQDAEFRIVSFEQGQGRAKGTIVYICEYTTKKGTLDQFRVVPRGTQQERRVWYQEGEQHVNQLLTVQFQKYSDNGAPVFPVGLCLRNYE